MTLEDDLREIPCPLCGSENSAPFTAAWGRGFLRCPDCLLTFAPPQDRLPPAEEAARYELHENDPADPAYRSFLRRLVDPLCDVLPPGAEGLDFGCGPGPTLSVMMRERGFPTADYDPFFRPDREVLRQRYDFISMTEVIEHLFRPGEELDRLVRMLRPGGWLGVMTEALLDDRTFAEWWYVRDPTHVGFYRPETMEWIASRFDLELRSISANIHLLRAPMDS
jgi:hypothetical protein